MSDHALSKRGRALEDEYFRKKDGNWSRKAAAGRSGRTGQARDGAPRSGSDDPEILQELSDGFTPDTVILLPLVPVIQMARADGSGRTGERA